MLISLNDEFPQHIFKQIDGDEKDGLEVPLESSQKVSDLKYRFKSSWFQWCLGCTRSCAIIVQ